VRRDPIVIVAHDPAWAVSFEVERSRVEPVMKPWLVRRVEHIGSTAVPGLAAKPIIDMVAVVRAIDEARGVIDALRGVGWRHAPEPSDAADRRLSFCTPSPECRTHHLHVVEEASVGWKGWLAFRDALRVQPELADDYAALKREMAVRHGHDPNQRDEYRNGKAAFITEVTAKASESHPL
jgi:GrpB-like predicted nucleotidyltransferase (UPF0157 family)